MTDHVGKQDPLSGAQIIQEGTMQGQNDARN